MLLAHNLHTGVGHSLTVNENRKNALRSMNFRSTRAFNWVGGDAVEELEQLVVEHQHSLFAFLYRMCGDSDLAEELTQETFVRALTAAKRYRPQARISTWLFSIAANLVRDRWRKNARRGEEIPLDDVGVVASNTTEDLALERIGQERVRQALLLLPLEQRSAILLRYYHDLIYEEIAYALACPLGTVRSRLHNGLARLKRMLVEEVNTGAGR
jgi:RNA polymerase sigma-70 factor (ECF subfamily)